jgi:acetyl esterase/lipase
VELGRVDVALPVAVADLATPPRAGLCRGYVVFAAMHGSQPKYTVPEAIEDVHRAVRFVRANAKTYGVDPNRLGIAGGSAGGHLALMMGCAGRAGNPTATDLVEKEPSNVAAVACFFPPTDFPALEGKCPKDVVAAFDFREFDSSSGTFAPVSAQRRFQIGVEASPVTHVTKRAAPTLIVHGDRDTLVPIEQSKTLIAKLKACGVYCELVVKAGKGHYWLGMEKDLPTLADWFDKHLLGKP